MLSKKENTNEIVTNLQKYWNYRAKSYSESNIEELNNFKGEAWLKILLKNAFSVLTNGEKVCII